MIGHKNLILFVNRSPHLFRVICKWSKCFTCWFDFYVSVSSVPCSFSIASSFWCRVFISPIYNSLQFKVWQCQTNAGFLPFQFHFTQHCVRCWRNWETPFRPILNSYRIMPLCIKFASGVSAHLTCRQYKAAGNTISSESFSFRSAIAYWYYVLTSPLTTSLSRDISAADCILSAPVNNTLHHYYGMALAVSSKLLNCHVPTESIFSF